MSHSYSRASSYTFRTTNTSTRSLRLSAQNATRHGSAVLREFLWWSTAPEGGVIEIDPEAMTKQERLSRMLHAPKGHAPLPNTGPLFEHFIVVGLPNASAQRPEMLFHYPSSNPVTIPGLPDFCFPSGLQPKKLRKTKSNSNLLQVLYSQSYHHEPENAYVFMLTTMEKEHLYGVCVIKHESINHKPSFFPRDTGVVSNDASDVVAPRCYCFVTRFPFFQLHFEALYSILDLEYMASVSDLQSAPISTAPRETPVLAHSQSLPSIPHMPSLPSSPLQPQQPQQQPEKKRKKIRLRSRSNGLDTRQDESNASAAQDQSPFPGIPLHTVYKMPVPHDQPTTSSSSSSPSPQEETTIVEKESTPLRRTSTADMSAAFSSSEQDSTARVLPVQAGATVMTMLGSQEMASSESLSEDGGGSRSSSRGASEEDLLNHESSVMDNRGRESGSEDGSSPTPMFSPRRCQEWKRKALAGRGIVRDGDSAESGGTQRKQRYGKEKDNNTGNSNSNSDSNGSSNEREEARTATKKQNPVMKVLHEYLTLGIPKPNHPVSFFVHKGLQTLRFHRPAFHDQDHLLSDWSLPLTFHLLSTDNLLTFVSACLLEKKVIVHSSNVRFLSAVLLSVMPLLRPFVYESVLIPILPDILLELLEAPVPFVLGLTAAPPKHAFPKDTRDFVIVDLDNDKISTKETLQTLPQFKELRKKLKPLMKVVSSGRQNGKVPYVVTEEQMSCCHGAALILHTFFSSLFANFRTYCLCDKTDSDKPISVFLKDSFLNDQPRPAKPFLSRFLETQLFFQYCDLRLRQIDAPPGNFPTV